MCIWVKIMVSSLYILCIYGHVFSSLRGAGHCISCMMNFYSIFFSLYLSIFNTSNANRFGGGMSVKARPLATVLTLCGAAGVLAPPFAYIDSKVWLMNACLFSTPANPRRPYQPPASLLACSDNHSSYGYIPPGRVVQEAVPSFLAMARVWWCGGTLGRWYADTLPGGIGTSSSLVFLDLFLLVTFTVCDFCLIFCIYYYYY